MVVDERARMYCRFTEFAKLMNVYLNHFPKHEKYGLAQAIRQAAYDVYGLMVEGQKRYHKKTTLTQLDIRHEQLRMLIGLAHELGYFGFRSGNRQDAGASLGAKRYIALSRGVDEVGRLIGGWLRSEREAARETS